MKLPKSFIIIVLLIILINFIGWLTKPDHYKSTQKYYGSLLSAQPYT